jgi:glycosyltransferase involved in cell wall biosynthesis
MKVVTIADVAPNKMGSFEKFLRDHSHYLSKEGIAHTIVFPQEPTPQVAESLELAGAKVIVFERLYDDNFRKCYQLYKAVLKEEPQILHVHFLKMLGFFSFFMSFTKIRFFATYHISGPCSKHILLKKLYKRIRWLLLGFSYDEIFCVSKYNRKKFLNDFEASPGVVSMIYNAINQAEFENYRQNFSTRICPNNKALKLISVAALIPEKGIQYLIGACAELSALGINYQLNIIGDGPYRDKLESLANSLEISDKIQFLGSRNDVPNLLLSGDIMIAPSVWDEAFGYTILEAMSVGIPLIVSNVGGIPELVEDNFNGLLVEKASPGEISRAIITLMNAPSLRAKFSARGISKSIKQFSVDQQCYKLLSSYNKSMGIKTTPSVRK